MWSVAYKASYNLDSRTTCYLDITLGFIILSLTRVRLMMKPFLNPFFNLIFSFGLDFGFSPSVLGEALKSTNISGAMIVDATSQAC